METQVQTNPLGRMRCFVEGAPYQPGERVQVEQVLDDGTMDEDEVVTHVDEEGVVEYLDYACGCGQVYPEQPMIGVVFPDGSHEEYWSEELSHAVD